VARFRANSTQISLKRQPKALDAGIGSVLASVYLQQASGIKAEIRYYRNYAHVIVGLES